MKTVFKYSCEVADVWAQQKQWYGRSRTGNLYFNDSTIYSYGSHCPLACIVIRDDGKRLILVNSTKHSVTTSGHKYCVEAAIQKYELGTVVEVPEPRVSFDMGGHFNNWMHFYTSIDLAVRKSVRARSTWIVSWHYGVACALRSAALTYGKFFRLPIACNTSIDRLTVSACKLYKAELVNRARRASNERWRLHRADLARQKLAAVAARKAEVQARAEAVAFRRRQTNLGKRRRRTIRWQYTNED